MKKKILHIQVLPKLSGVQKISLEIFKGLSNEQYEKWVFFSNSTDTGDKVYCEREFKAVGVNVVYSSKMKREIGFSDFGAMLEIYKLCRREKFDIVHTHSTKPGIIGRIAATLAHTPLVIHTIHGLAFHQFVKFPKWQFYWACEMFASLFCDKITMVNRYYFRYFRWCSKKVSTIYNGIDFSVYGDIIKNNIEKDVFKILFVGRLDVQKDPLMLLRAAKLVISKYTNVKFTLVGDGEMYNECKTFIFQNDLSKNINLTGWQSDVRNFYASHDIFVMSSIYESFGLIFLEAAHYELPVVATNVEGIPEVVINNETGLLCKPRDPHALADNIFRLIEDRAFAKKLGKTSRLRAHTLFTQKRMTDEFIAIYKTIDN